MNNYVIPVLPFPQDIETKPVLKKLPLAHKALAELNGVAETIPNEVIILNTLSLQEAKDSSAIENIITTHDELYSSDNLAQQFASTAAKEVHNYATALKEGVKLVKQKGFLSCNQIIKIQETLEESNAGFRKLPGTNLRNELTGEIVYTPPQSYDEIAGHMSNQLIERGLVTRHKSGKENYYINDALLQYLYDAPELLRFRGKN